MRASGAMVLTSTMRRSVSGRMSAARGRGLWPRVLALFTSRSRPPSTSAARAKARRCPGSVTSPATARTCALPLRRSRTSSAAADSPDSPRASSTRDHPWVASPLARAFPSPLDAPVTIATAMINLPRPTRGPERAHRQHVPLNLIKQANACFIFPPAGGDGE